MSVDSVDQAYLQIRGFHNPNPMQQQVWKRITNSDWGAGVLLKAPTGSGKTEAVAVPGLATDRRLIMVYPTRSLVDDQTKRFQEMLALWSNYTLGRPLTLVVDTGAQSLRQAWKAGKEIPLMGNSRRHLYNGDVIITTLDKFLYRYFGFGEPKKAYTYPLRIHYGSYKTLICFDEAHAYEDVAFTNFNRLVKTLYEKGNDVVLMTATMPSEFAREFEYLETVDFIENAAYQEQLAQFTLEHFPSRNHPEKRLTYLPLSILAEPESQSLAIQRMVSLAEEHWSADKRLIVTAERVEDAIAIYRALRDTLPESEVLLYHGRLTGERRTEVYQRLLDLEEAKLGYVLVSTSAIEVGCDLNAHVLITQLCDPECLIQRAGRCNRRQEMADAEVIVVGDTVPSWSTNLQPDDLQRYREELHTQSGMALDTHALARCIRKHPNPDDHVEMMFDMLYEYVYEAKLENKQLHDRGLIVTRSWEPSLTLCQSYEDKKGASKAIEVPMSRCVVGKDEPLTPMWSVCKETFDPEQKWQLKPLGRWECGYSVDVIVQMMNGSFDEEIGYEHLPKIFKGQYRTGYRHVLVREEGKDKSLIWYLDPASGSFEDAMAKELSVASESDNAGGDEDAD